MRVAHGGGRHTGNAHLAAVQRGSRRRIALDDKRHEVALQDGAPRILQTRREDQRGRLVRHRDSEGRQRLRHPGPVGHTPHSRVPGAPLAQRIPTVQLGAQREGVTERRATGQERCVERHIDALAGTNRPAQLRIPDHDIERRVEIAQRHPGHQVAEARLLPRAVVAPIPVPLVDHIVMLGVQPAADFGMTPKRVDGTMVVPAPIDVARAAFIAPHVAELRITHRLTYLPPRGSEVPGPSWERAVAEPLVVRLPTPPGQVLVPRVEIGLGMAAAAAHRVVFDESSRVQRLG